LGKALLKLGKAKEARPCLEEAAAAGEYYGLRAEILRQGDEGQKRMAAWLDSPEGGLRSLKEAIEEDSRFERGRKLLNHGLREEAMAEFEDRYPVQPVSPSMHPRRGHPAA